MKTNDFIVKRTKPAQTIVESAAPVAATELQFPQVDYGRRFNKLNGVNESQGTARKYQTSKPEINFTAADINELSAIKDLPTLRARALQLISTSSAHPMKPEKVEWFRNAMENMNSPMRIIKLMYDLLLSGEGNKVLGSKNSMAPNSYRSRFGESNMSEDEELDGMALGELRAIVQDAKKIYQCVKNGTPLEAWMYKKITNSNESLTAVAQQIDNPGIRSPEGVAEGHADQQRKIFKKNGKPVGEVGIDPEASPGNGNWYVKHYASGYDVVGFDSYEEAVAELKYCMEQGVAEGDSQEPKGRMKSDGTRSHNTYGSRDGHNISGPDLTAKATTPKKVIKKGTDVLDRAFKDAEQDKRTVKENATGGVTGAASVAVVSGALGEKGGFSRADLNKKLGGYSNRLTNVKKATKVKV